MRAWMMAIAALALVACSSSPELGSSQRRAPVTANASPAPVAPPPRPPSGEHANEPDDWSFGFGLEWAEADTITVDTLQAITVEAHEIECGDIVRTRHYPTTKDTRWLRLEGHVIEGKTLIAHHVQARLIRAQRIVAHRIIRPKRPYVWSSGGQDAGLVRNRVVRVVGGVAQDAGLLAR
jgi:hypothetical protein